MKKNKIKILTKPTFRSMKKGFSLVEVLFTLMILSVGTSTAAVLMTNNIKNSINAKNQVIASELAQEGVELVKNLKDNNPIFTTDISDGNDYRVEYISDFVSGYTAFKNSPINFPGDVRKRVDLSGAGFFLHAVGTPTKFYRKIAISTVGGNRRAESFVTWNGSGFAVMAVGWPASCNVASKCVSVVSVLPDL